MSEVTSWQNVNSSNNVTGGGVDYDSGPYDVTFSAGETSASLLLPIIDDNILEGVEDFTVTIDDSSLPQSVNRVDPFSANVIVTDDDREWPQTVINLVSNYSQ